MTTALPTPTALSLIEGNLVTYWRDLGRFPGFTLRDHPGSFSVTSGVHDALFNAAFAQPCVDVALDVQVDLLLTAMRQVGLPFVYWVLPSAPAGLGELLEQRGLSFVEHGTCMAMDLRPPLREVAVPADLTLQWVMDDQTEQQHVRVIRDAFEVSPEVADVLARRFTYVFGRGQDSPMQSVLGEVNGQLVGCGSLFLGAGTAGVYTVGVTPLARRRGVGAALTRALLDLARWRGFETAILLSSAAGLNVYRSLGFEPYGEMRQYVWLPEGEGAR
ncbi:GNAT family N-acetyltransferase [Deinococcus sonorensis]|uniref:GNAT family N-acetyltransferase n=2 Tax=Deinococcus sonorensis TaxID=309891 RepID=A0AAU7U617_9DEIO